MYEIRLGKKPVRHDVRTLSFQKYAKALPAAPVAQAWSAAVKTPWHMFANDRIGDCTCASAAHMIMTWTANARKIITPTESSVLAAYSAITGYSPSTPNSDNGAVELDVLNYWRKHGISGHKIMAYAKVNPQNLDEVRQATNIFGGLYLGVSLPIAAQGEKIWDIPANVHRTGRWRPGSWGGHAVPIVDYTPSGFDVVTWGSEMQVTNAFFETYVEEAYAIITHDWVRADGMAPSGFDILQMTNDLALLTD